MRTNCIYCGLPLDNSDEHIIPDSINGQLHTRTLICSACNNKFGVKLDPVIKESLHFILHMMGIGKAETMWVEDQDGKAYIVDRAGKAKMVKTEVGTFKQGEKTGISVSGEKTAAIRAFAKKVTRTFGKHALQVMDTAAFEWTERSVVTQELKAKAKLASSPRLLLALDKIITEFYAYSGLDIELIRPRLQKVWELNESNPETILTNFEQQVRVPGDKEVGHLIVIRSDAARREVYGYVELFNVVCGYTVLVRDYEGPAINAVWHQDALTGAELTEAVELHTEKLTREKEDFGLLINSLLERKRGLDQLAMVDEAITAIKEPLDKQLAEGLITEAEHLEQYIDQTTKAVAELMVFAFPDDVEDFSEEDQKNIHYIHSVIREAHREEFEFCYHQLPGKHFIIEGVTYTLDRFIFAKHPPKGDEPRLKAYGRFRSDKPARELDKPVYEFFSGIGLPPPEGNVPWL